MKQSRYKNLSQEGQNFAAFTGSVVGKLRFGTGCKFFSVLIVLLSLALHGYWTYEIKPGTAPGSVDPFLKIIQGYSLYTTNFNTQSLYYPLKDIDMEREFIPFQRDIFAIRLNHDLIGPFPIALSALIACMLYFCSPFFLFYIFAFLNFLLYFFIYNNVRKSRHILIFIFFGLPFFIPNSEVSEHSIIVFQQVLSLGLLFKFVKNRHSKKRNFDLALSGLCLGSILFFRHEIMIFALFMVLSILFYSIQKSKRKLFEAKHLFIFVAGISVSFLLFFALNLYLYNNFLGPRVVANSSAIFSSITEKVNFFKTILWKNPPWFGFFGYSRIYLLTLLGFFYFRKRFNSIDRILLASCFGMFLFIPLLAPNDGGAPWGARYLFLAVYPMVYLTAKLIGLIYARNDRNLRYIFIFLFYLFIAHTLYVESRGIVSMVKVGDMQRGYISEIKSEKADLYVFTNELVVMQVGLQYLLRPLVLLNDESKIEMFDKKILMSPNYKQIVLIEPKLNHINPGAFSVEERKGFSPQKIIKAFDQRLFKLKTMEREYTILHVYQNTRHTDEKNFSVKP